MKKGKRILSTLMALILCLSMLPAMAAADQRIASRREYVLMGLLSRNAVRQGVIFSAYFAGSAQNCFGQSGQQKPITRPS